jgi:hypothetical protein
MMSIVLYLLVIAVWVGLAELALYYWRRDEYRRIDAMRRQAETLLREARLARLRATVSLHRADAAVSSYTKRAS